MIASLISLGRIGQPSKTWHVQFETQVTGTFSTVLQTLTPLEIYFVLVTPSPLVLKICMPSL